MCENSYAIYEKRFKLEKNLDEKYEYIIIYNKLFIIPFTNKRGNYYGDTSI